MKLSAGRSLAAAGRVYDLATTWLLALTGVAMFVIAIGNALLRYFFDSPLIWGEEIARYCMVWGTLIGVALGYRAGTHVAITLLANVVPPVIQIAFRLACHTLTLGVAFLMWRSGTVLAALLGRIQAPSSGLDMVWIYAAIPVGAVMLAIEVLRQLVGEASGRTAA